MNTRVDLGSVIGPKGATGATGPRGATGATGPQGEKGATVRLVPKAQLVLLEHAAAAGTRELQSPAHLQQQLFLQEAGSQTRW